MTRSRMPVVGPPRHAAPKGPPATARRLSTLLTLALLPFASFVLVARVRAVLAPGGGLTDSCAGADVLGVALLVGLPAVVLVVAILAALASISRREDGWLWLALAVVTALVTQVAAAVLLPDCVP